MLRRSLVLLCSGICFLVPLFAFAHASPVEYTPEELSVMASPPEEVSIRFSERIEPSASSMKLFPPQGGGVPLSAVVDAEDPYFFSARFDAMMLDRPDGVYTLSWQVVSSDDGHYTKGAFQFIVGTGTPAALSEASVEVVHSSSYLEATTIAMKLLGESMLVALLFLLWLAGRSNILTDETRMRLAVYAKWFLCAAGSLLLLGGISYFILKTAKLAEVQSVSFIEAVPKFIPTTAGEMTILLLILLIAFMVLARGISTRLLSGERLTLLHWLSLAALFFISYSQARLSHAAASHIFPTFSVFMNIPHLLGKGLWIGGLLALVFVFFPALRGGDRRMRAAMHLWFGYAAAAALFLGGISGVWIIWLHLKSFDNVFSSAWGSVFILLAAFAFVLGLLRIAALLFLERMTRCLNCAWSYATLEALVGVSVLFFSALIIITSPPLTYAPLFIATTMERGSMIHLTDPGLGQQILHVSAVDAGGIPVTGAAGTVTLVNSAEGIGPIVIHPKEKNGMYEIPTASLVPSGRWEIAVTLSRPGVYDTNGKFFLDYPKDIAAVREVASSPSFGMFTKSMIGIALLVIMCAVFFVILTKKNYSYAQLHPEIFSAEDSVGFWRGQMIAVLVFLCFAGSIWFIHKEITNPSMSMANMHAGHQM